MDYRQALSYVYAFTNFEVTPAGDYSSKTFDLSRMEHLLASLGEPQKKFRSVHVAGTKGKGSTAAMLESILRTAGHRTGLYTSPHLHTFRERIRVQGKMINTAEVAAGIDKIKPLAADIAGLTTFEMITALAFDYFAAHGVEIALLEVGLGGRLDATNVVTPLVSVLTSISYDHMAILGTTLSEIAAEKAGIIKPGVPTVSSPQQPEALAVIEAAASEKNSSLVLISPDLQFQASGLSFHLVPITQTLDAQTFTLHTEIPAAAAPGVSTGASLDLRPQTLTLKLIGRHQLVNAATAIATVTILRRLGIQIPNNAIDRGLASVEWPGRFEVLSVGPLIVVDGAHNADSAHQLRVTIRAVRPDGRLYLVFGASSDKDINGMFSEILPESTVLVLTASHNPRAIKPARLAELARPFGIETVATADVAGALHEAQRRARADDIICVTGSLFVVAEARKEWFSQHDIKIETD